VLICARAKRSADADVVRPADCFEDPTPQARAGPGERAAGFSAGFSSVPALAEPADQRAGVRIVLLLLTFSPDALSTGLELVQVLGLAGLILAALLLVARC